MTKEQFRALPYLVQPIDVVQMGYGPATVDKFVDCGVLNKIKPAGTQFVRFQKRQLALLLRWAELLEPKLFQEEPPLMRIKSVHLWTGYSMNTLTAIGRAGGIGIVKPVGMSQVKFLKADVARLIGFEEYL